MIYLRLFWEFFKTGLFSIGGGLATIPFLQEIALRTGWYTLSDLTNMIAVAEATPGPIGLNTPTYVGFTVGGVLGSAIATLSVVLPSFIIVNIIARMMKKFRDNAVVNHVFSGLRPASIGLIAAAGAEVAKLVFINNDAFGLTGSYSDLISYKSAIFAAAIFALTRIKIFKNLHPTIYIAFGALVGIIFKFAA